MALKIQLIRTIDINWNAEPENALTFPVGLGYKRTVFIGKTTVKMRLEPQYSVVKPGDYGMYGISEYK